MTDGSLALTLLRAVISLVLVLGLLVVTLRILAKRGGFSTSRRAGVDVEVLGRRQLSRTTSVQVVKVAGQVLVLGVTDSEVSVLTHLSPEALPADEDTETAEFDTTTPPAGLLDALRRQGGSARLVIAGGRSRGGRHRGGSRV